MKVLLTTCSYQDTPGPHHELMESQGWEITRERGPLTEQRMLELAGDFDAFLCGDDAITRAVLEKSLPRLKVISKYGIGLDKIDVPATKEFEIPVLFTPGVNHMTVAEHTFGLLIGLTKHIVTTAAAARNGEWLRLTGHEIYEKNHGHHRPRPHRQGSRRPCPRLRHESHRLRSLLGRRIRSQTRHHALRHHGRSAHPGRCRFAALQT